MCELPRVYCCVEHRDEKLTTLSLISHLSRAYTEALTLLKRQLRITEECRNNRADCIPLLQHQKHEGERIDNVLSVLQRVIKEFNNITSDDPMEYKEPSDSDFDADNTVIIPVKKEELPQSPVLMNRPKLKRTVPIISDSTLGDEQNDLCSTPSPFFKHEADRIKDTLNQENDDKLSISVFNTSANNDVIDCTPVQKPYKRVGLSKLYNVDTTISRTGKKLRQAKLFLEPFKENFDISQCQKVSTPKSEVSLKGKNVEKNNDQNQSIIDEIIENSPQRSTTSSMMKSRSESLLGHNAARTKVVKSLYKDDDNILKSHRKEKQPSKETSPVQFSQFSPLISSTQYGSCSFNKRSSSKENCDLSSILVSTSGANTSETRINAKRKDPSPLLHVINETKEDSDNSNRSKRKISESPLHDETYFAPTPIEKQTSPTSYDRPPPKMTKSNSSCKSKKTKEEKAKLDGINCWECQKYFNEGGGNNAQIKARLKACSRHRSKFVTRQSSPEGLWEAGFPDTQSSTMGQF